MSIFHYSVARVSTIYAGTRRERWRVNRILGTLQTPGELRGSILFRAVVSVTRPTTVTYRDRGNPVTRAPRHTYRQRARSVIGATTLRVLFSGKFFFPPRRKL